MTVRQPQQLLLAGVALILGLMLVTFNPLVDVIGMFIDGFALAIWLVLRHTFWIEATDRDGETWRLEWRRIE